jgi:hypothetical protein
MTVAVVLGVEGCVCLGAGAMLVVDTAARTLARTE